MLLFLETILVSAISLALKFRTRPGIHSIGEDKDIEKQAQHFCGTGSEGFFGDFSTSIPFFNEFVLFDLVGRWYGSSGHAASVDPNQSINPSIHQSIHPSIHQSINQSINQSI